MLQTAKGPHEPHSRGTRSSSPIRPTTLSGVHPAWWLYPSAMERLSQSSKRVGPKRGLSPGEALIVQLCAEVACVDVCGHLPCVSVCAQESSDEFVETYRFGPASSTVPFNGSSTATLQFQLSLSSELLERLSVRGRFKRQPHIKLCAIGTRAEVDFPVMPLDDDPVADNQAESRA